MQNDWQRHAGIKDVGDYHEPLEQDKLIPWGWIMIGVFAIVDALVILRLSEWTRTAFEAWEQANIAGVVETKVADADMFQPFSRLVISIVITLAVIITQAIALWIYSLRRS